MMANELLFGITGSSVMHTDADPELDLDTQFRMVKEAGVYDYIDKTPPEDEVEQYRACSEKYELPVHGSGWYYTYGQDEALFEKNIRIAAELGSKVHNTQIGTCDADGKPVTNEQVADTYERFYEFSQNHGVDACFEIHVNMWSEDFRRVVPVAEMVKSRGIPYYMTLDHSHVIFKIDNPDEQDVGGIREDVESGRLILDPFKEGNVVDQWIQGGYVRHAHARSAAPNGPKNIWDVDDNGKPGRGIQYPFIKPEPGQWHSEWDEANLEPWKECIRRLLSYHARDENCLLGQISTEFIPWSDYGGRAKYSIFEHSVACAQWMRETWADCQT